MTFLPQEIIRKKRDRQTLSASDIQKFVAGIASGGVSEAQAAAFTMSVFLNGMGADEILILTQSMKESGQVLKWDSMDGPVIDKHSTGGVGDKVSLMLAPIAATCGCYVPMISGRGLGHTGGTLDKMNAIPGYNTNPDIPAFQRIVRQVGCLIIGQTKEMAPADRILYAVRDVTATVESIPLITASILSKKLCAGLDALTMDIKTGNGAFMDSLPRAEELGQSIKTVAEKDGVRTGVLITDMNEVLGRTAGNALEVFEAVSYLKNENPEPRLKAVTDALCVNMLMIAGICRTEAEAEEKVRTALTSGKALEKFAEMVAVNGGPADFCDRPDAYMPVAPVIQPVNAPADGYIARQDTRRIGLAVTAMGGGRIRTSDPIDYRVGFADIRPLGTAVKRGDAIATVHAASAQSAEHAAREYTASVELSDTPPARSPAVIRR